MQYLMATMVICNSVACMACITLFVGVTMETCKAYLIRYNLLWSAFNITCVNVVVCHRCQGIVERSSVLNLVNLSDSFRYAVVYTVFVYCLFVDTIADTNLSQHSTVVVWVWLWLL